MGPPLTVLQLELLLGSLSVAAKIKKVERTFPGLSLHSLNRRRYNNKRKAERKEEFPSAKYLRGAWFFYVPYGKKHQCCILKKWGRYSHPWVEQTAPGPPALLHSHQALRRCRLLPRTGYPGPTELVRVWHGTCISQAAGFPNSGTHAGLQSPHMCAGACMPKTKARIEVTLKSA